MSPRPLSCVSLDFWDTLYDGTTLPARLELRIAAVGTLFAAVGTPVEDAELRELYRAAGREAHRWWQDEHRGYTTDERLRWILRQRGIERPPDCQHLAAACTAVDDALLAHPPALLPGAGELVEALAGRYALAIISDTGFPSGRAQDRLLERDGLLGHFRARVYSMDVGHAKPRPEPFRTALATLGAAPDEALHVGDIERTDVRGALAAGMRAVRCDVAREQGASAAELVVRDFEELAEYLDVI